jgi:hypothetical protein
MPPPIRCAACPSPHTWNHAEDAVVLAVQLGTLADGTSYTAQTTLDAAAKKIRVVIQNAGHHPLGR